MGRFLRKVKPANNGPAPHFCNFPLLETIVSGKKRFGEGTRWRCGKCKRVWEVRGTRRQTWMLADES